LGAALVAALEEDDRRLSHYRRLLHAHGQVIERAVSYRVGDAVLGKFAYPSSRSSVAGAWGAL